MDSLVTSSRYVSLECEPAPACPVQYIPARQRYRIELKGEVVSIKVLVVSPLPDHKGALGAETEHAALWAG